MEDQAVKELAEEIKDRGGIEHLVDRLTGRKGGLRPSKPQAQGDDGIEVYVWRMARFHSGKDPRMPVTCRWELSNTLKELGIEASVSGIMDEEGKAITDFLEEVVTVVCAKLGENPFKGALRWKETGLFG